MRKGGGFGMVVLVIVLAVVLLLVAKQWKAVAPTAVQLDGDHVTMTPDDHGQPEAGEALQRGGLPDLQDMRQATGTHTAEVQDALAEVE